MQIAAWNVNSIKSRLQHLLEWLRRDAPDIVLLQETKCTDDTFPAMEIEELGYNIAMHGEKSYNGVAILSKFPLEDIRKGLPGAGEDAQTRYIEAVVDIPGGAMRVASVYVPNGQEPASEKFQYKLQFLERLSAHVKTLLTYDEMLAIGGDYNIAPEEDDVHNPQAWANTVLTHSDVRKRFRKIMYCGIYDAYRVLPAVEREGLYTWWDYRANGFVRDDGLRIDHVLLSPQAADRLAHFKVLKELRALEKASDHAPVVAEIVIPA